jgi:hypothetical protein
MTIAIRGLRVLSFSVENISIRTMTGVIMTTQRSSKFQKDLIYSL